MPLPFLSPDSCRAPRTLGGLLAVASLTIAACGSDSDTTSSSATPTGRPTVLATTTIWADVTSNIACDGLADVETIIPPGGDPHAFEPSLQDRETMEHAALIVANGLLLEESLDDTIHAVEDDGIPVLRIADELETITTSDDEDHDDEEHDDEEDHDDDHEDHQDEEHDEEDHDDDHEDHQDEEHDEEAHDHGGVDPHVWFDPTLVAEAVPAIVDALAETGIDRAALQTCADAYTDELDALDADVATIVEPLPADARVLVTNHDSLGYFAEHYGFEVLGSVIPSSSSLAEANPSDLDELATQIEDTGIPAIFAETQHSSSDTEALAARLDGVEVATLLTDTLDEPGTPADSYVGWLRATATTIVEALTPAGDE